ncbi:hypothetical protein M3Y99_00273300 [Aphelenchoides fujianensis]|nr:hypothetical protein M3Y99_00273300 [Aphelenchoides fujianensis]
MPREQLKLPVGGRRKSRATSAAPSTRRDQPPSHRSLSTGFRPAQSTSRSQATNLPSVRRGGKLMALDGRQLNPTDSRDINTQMEELLDEKRRVDRKLVTKTHAFKDVLIYCKKTIDNQDFEIARLDEGLRKCEDNYEEKLRKERQQAHEEMSEMRVTVERLNTENLMMKTQLSNLDQLELELKEAMEKVEALEKEIEDKNEKIGKRELKERELVIITTERVRKELEIEFAQEIEKVKRELQIQNLAQMEANLHIVKKVKADMQKVEQERAVVQTEMNRLVGELEAKQQAYAAMEKEKQRLDAVMQKANDAANQRLHDLHRTLEKAEARLRDDNEAHETEMTKMSRELEDLTEKLEETTKQMTTAQLNLKSETETRKVISRKLQEQNRKLIALRDFLETVFEQNNDEYIDFMLGENRAAVFAKLSTLLRTIPILAEAPSAQPILPKKF